MGPHSAAGRVSKPSTVTAGVSAHPTRSYVANVRSARRAKCKRRAAAESFIAKSWSSAGSTRDMSSDRVKPLVCSGSMGDRVKPSGNRLRSRCRGARFNGPLPEPRPKERTISLNSFKSCNFFRSFSISSHPVTCHKPLDKSNPSGPSVKSFKSKPSNAFEAFSSLSTAGSHCSLKSSIIFSTISFFSFSFCFSSSSAFDEAFSEESFDSMFISISSTSVSSFPSPSPLDPPPLVSPFGSPSSWLSSFPDPLPSGFISSSSFGSCSPPLL